MVRSIHPGAYRGDTHRAVTDKPQAVQEQQDEVTYSALLNGQEMIGV